MASRLYHMGEDVKNTYEKFFMACRSHHVRSVRGCIASKSRRAPASSDIVPCGASTGPRSCMKRPVQRWVRRRMAASGATPPFRVYQAQPKSSRGGGRQLGGDRSSPRSNGIHLRAQRGARRRLLPLALVPAQGGVLGSHRGCRVDVDQVGGPDRVAVAPDPVNGPSGRWRAARGTSWPNPPTPRHSRT